MTRAHKEIKLVRVGQVKAEVLDYLTLILSSTFSVRCELCDLQIDPRSAYAAKRQQFDSNRILQQLVDLRIPDDCRVLGITEVDLFVPIFTFVFGLSQVDGRAALMSTCRLQQQFYGLPEDNALFLLRCEKEAIHELGHACGLVHCARYECVMHFSNSIEDVDLRSATFCSSCSEAVLTTRPISSHVR